MGVEPKIGVGPHGTPKSSILIGFSIIFTIHFGVPLFLERDSYPIQSGQIIKIHPPGLIIKVIHQTRMFGKKNHLELVGFWVLVVKNHGSAFFSPMEILAHRQFFAPHPSTCANLYIQGTVVPSLCQGKAIEVASRLGANRKGGKSFELKNSRRLCPLFIWM